MNEAIMWILVLQGMTLLALFVLGCLVLGKDTRKEPTESTE